MPEVFLDKKPGDVLTAQDINELRIVAERLAKMKGGRGIDVRHTRTQFDQSSQTPHIQHVIEILEITTPGELYRGAIRSYNHVTDEWVTLTSNQTYTGLESTPTPNAWLIDGSESLLDLQLSDIVICYWDRQRGAFIPTETVGHPLIDVTASRTLLGGGQSELIGDFHHFDITVAIIHTFDPSGVRSIMDNRRLTRTVKRHQEDGTVRSESMGIISTWYNENTPAGLDFIDIGVSASSGRRADITAALRIELLRGNRERQVVRAMGTPGSGEGLTPLIFDDSATVVVDDLIGGSLRPVFELQNTHLDTVRIRPPENTNTRFLPPDGFGKWTIRCEAIVQFDYS